SLASEVTDDPSRVFGTIKPRRVEVVDDDGPALPDLFTTPVGNGGPIGRLLQRMARPSRSSGGPPGGETPTRVADAPPGDRRGVPGSVAPPPSTETRGAKRNGITYPEWDVQSRRYRPDWCTVVETDAPTRTGALPTLTNSDAMRRALARLGVGLASVRRRAQG